MRRGTTDTVTLNVGMDLTGLDPRVAFKEGKTLIVKEGDELDTSLRAGKTVIRVRLTQEETLRFREGRECKVQVRAANEDGSIAVATNEKGIPIEGILQEGVLDGQH